jgi:hypothetical protein
VDAAFFRVARIVGTRVIVVAHDGRSDADATKTMGFSDAVIFSFAVGAVNYRGDKADSNPRITERVITNWKLIVFTFARPVRAAFERRYVRERLFNIDVIVLNITGYVQIAVHVGSNIGQDQVGLAFIGFDVQINNISLKVCVFSIDKF